MNKTAIIETKAGKIQGYTEEGLEIFKGIPYAEPPIGKLRFAPPVRKQKWKGVLNTMEYGPCAFQGHSELEQYLGKLEPESEDCLSLNIWTPATDGGNRPVMFWIHGGAFMMGGGIDPLYDGSSLAVSRITGILERCRINCRTSKPSTPGIPISRTAASGWFPSKASCAARPSLAVTTSNPSSPKLSLSNLSRGSSSSATRIVGLFFTPLNLLT